MKILMISTCNYGPENKNGTKKILYNILKRNCNWEVDFVSFDDFDEEFNNLDNFNNYIVKNRKNFLFNIFKNPWALRFYNMDILKKKVKVLLNNNYYDSIIVVNGILANIVDTFPSNYKKRTVLLAIDSMPLFWKRKIDKISKYIKLKALIQYYLWRNYERKYENFEKVIFVSDLDEKFYTEKANNKNALTINNGIDIEQFKYQKFNKNNESLVFTGNMEYEPNKEAASFLIEKIYSRLNKEYSGIKLYVIGIGAKKFGISYNNITNIIFIDFIEDMSDGLRNANIYVSPLQHGAGIKNKILEAMSTGKMIIGSKISFDGINGIDDNLISIAETEYEYIHYIREKLNISKEEAEDIGKKLSDFTREKYSWDKIAKIYDDLLNNICI